MLCGTPETLKRWRSDVTFDNESHSIFVRERNALVMSRTGEETVVLGVDHEQLARLDDMVCLVLCL